MPAAPSDSVPPKAPAANDTERPGKVLGSENRMSDNLDPQLAGSRVFKKAKEAYGPSAHQVQWGPDIFHAYTDYDNPFYYRCPKELAEAPAHFPQNPMVLEMHLRNERQRLAGMTNAEREWRKKYMKSLELHPDEPFYIKEAQLPLNPFRRLYRWPWDTLGRKFLYPYFGNKKGYRIRMFVPQFLFTLLTVEYIYYHAKYNHEVWWDLQRLSTYKSRVGLVHRDEIEAKYPGAIEKGYPELGYKDHYDLGFSQRTHFLNLGETARPW